MEDLEIHREKCYECYRPIVSCLCKHITKTETNTKFILLMHPKEFKKTKNGTGHLTNKSLTNSEIYIGIDFSNHKRINQLLDDENNNCFVLYPDEHSIKLNTQSIKSNKNIVIFIIDSTWACSKKMLRLSQRLNALPKVSFTHDKSSQFKIKKQPNIHCLSTIESTLCILELLNKQNIENITNDKLDNFLNPFTNMVSYQINCIAKKEPTIRYKSTLDIN